MKKDRFIHKHGYGYLFSNKILIKELIESFVSKDFADQLDFSVFEPMVEKSYISEEFADFADDLLVKVGLNGEEAYIYLFIEFQSTNDRFMALRMLNYIILFYMDYLKEKKEVKKLPPVLPILLYNGNSKWTAPDSIRELIEPNEFLKSYYPDFQYFKILENEYGREELLAINNAVSGIFLLENTDREDFQAITKNLVDILSSESVETIALLAVWIKHLFKNERIDRSIYEEITSLNNDKEAKSMLVDTIKELQEEWKNDGKIEDAQRMLEMDYPVEDIVKITGLSREEIEKLKK
ncbi:MAG: Rpn family recombination-promoting nuclease/putative transposase [Spirochaetia bacterium]